VLTVKELTFFLTGKSLSYANSIDNRISIKNVLNYKSPYVQ